MAKMPNVFSTKNTKKEQGTKYPQANRSSEIKRDGTQFVRKVLKGKARKDYRPLSAFRLYPYKTEFFQKDPEEKVILLFFFIIYSSYMFSLHNL